MSVFRGLVRSRHAVLSGLPDDLQQLQQHELSGVCRSQHVAERNQLRVRPGLLQFCPDHVHGLRGQLSDVFADFDELHVVQQCSVPGSVGQHVRLHAGLLQQRHGLPGM